MKKVILITFIIVSALAVLTGCSLKKQNLAGVDKVEKTISDVNAYSSAEVVFTNEETGSPVQSFRYTFDGDKMVYLYRQFNADGQEKLTYSNGTDTWVKDYGEDTAQKMNDSVNFPAYTKTSRHIFATGNVIFYMNGFIQMHVANERADGPTTYMYTYNADKVSEKTGANIKSITTTFYYNKDGSFMYMLQDNKSVSEYKEISMNTRLEFKDVNQVVSIENPFENQ